MLAKKRNSFQAINPRKGQFENLQLMGEVDV